MTKNYFENEVDMAVEIEYETGGRNWYTMKGSAVKDFCDRRAEAGDGISDIDYCSKQSNPAIRALLDKAWEAFRAPESPYGSYFKAIEAMLEEEPAEAPAEPSKKVWDEDEIKHLIQTNDIVLYRALLMLYDCQSNAEKSTASTREANGVGFNAYDAEFLTSVSEFLKHRGYLSDKQKYITRRKLVKYNRQLTRLANE